MEACKPQYPIRFWAAILEKTGHPLVIDEITFTGPLEAGQVLVRVHYSGICGKQIEEIRGTKGPDPYLPHLLGHEGSGVVMDVGPGVTKVVPGNPVVLHWLNGSGLGSEIPQYRQNGRRIQAGWVTTFNEYAVVSENRVTPLKTGTDLSLACLLGCAVTTGVGVILNEARPQRGEGVAVFGCGGVGLSAIQAAALLHCYPIIAVDVKEAGLQLAYRLGATHTIQPEFGEVLKKIREITVGRGVPTVILSTGEPTAIELAVEASTVPGTVYFVGVPPTGAKVTIDPFAIHCRRNLVGSYGGGTYPDRDIPRYWELYLEGHLKLKELVMKYIPLEGINEGVDALISGQAGRCIVDMGVRND